MKRTDRRILDAALPAVALLFILAGLAALFLPDGADTAARVWMAGLVLTAAPLLYRTGAGLVQGRFAADVVAALAMITAVLLGEPLPGLIVVLMQTGGEALDRYAEGRASQAVRELEAAAPRFAHRIENGTVVDIAAAELVAGDLVLVRPGELIPCDGTVESGSSHVDTSTLTGEPVPLSAVPGTVLMSGCANGEGALTMRATRASAESRYARVVELVRSAQESKSPTQRVADRYAVWFTPLTLVVCAIAYWLSGDATRILAVLVVATPCPLILATPVAIIGGINRAARRQIIVRDGGALERLASVDTALFDKTGTLTYGMPSLSAVHATSGFTSDDVLQLAASLEQSSGHQLGRVVVEHALARGLPLSTATDVRERAGRGISGTVAGRTVSVGTRGLMHELHPSLGAMPGEAEVGDGMYAFVAIDGVHAGTIMFADRIRADAAHLLEAMTVLGLRRTALLSGDHASHVAAVAAELGFSDAHGELMPEDKVRIVREYLQDSRGVVMVGDGVNDAPALSTATVGVALAGHGGGITAEAADIVILVDEPARLADAIRISRRTLRIARQSIGAGLGLSLVAMGFAAAGYIPPTAGALIQEVIDIAVIVNALRASSA